MHKFFKLSANLETLFRFLSYISVVCVAMYLYVGFAYPLFFDFDISVGKKAPVGEVRITANANPTMLNALVPGAKTDAELSGFNGTLSLGREDTVLLKTHTKANAPRNLIWGLYLCVLFRLLQQICLLADKGEFFSEGSVRIIRWIGITLVVYSVLGIAADWWSARVMQAYITEHISATGVRAAMTSGWEAAPHRLIAGLLVLLLARAFSQGLALKREAELTI